MIAEHVQIPRFSAQEYHKEDDKPVSRVCVMWCSQRSVSTGTFFCYICFTIVLLLVISQIAWQQKLMCKLEDDFHRVDFEDRTPIHSVSGKHQSPDAFF